MTVDDIRAIEEIINKKRAEAKKKENAESKSSKRIALTVHLKVFETIIQPKGDLSEMVLESALKTFYSSHYSPCT